MVSKFVNGALGQTRTGTPVKATDFESVASTNSATRAAQACNITESFLTSRITFPELLKVPTLHPHRFLTPSVLQIIFANTRLMSRFCLNAKGAPKDAKDPKDPKDNATDDEKAL